MPDHAIQVILSKPLLRQEYSEKRDALSESYVKENSRQIAKNLFAIKEFEDSRNILFYLSLEKEVQTGEMIEGSLKLGKHVYVPIVDQKAHDMKVSELPGLEIEFETGAYGIREPGRRHQQLVSPDRIDFVVAPGLVFDLQGGRIGFGGGYYDRFLKNLPPSAVTAGVAFAFQVLESVPLNENDIRVQKIITEKKTIHC